MSEICLLDLFGFLITRASKQWYTIHGFDDTQITTDIRWKLSHLLQERGLWRHDYAREMVTRLSKPAQKEFQAQWPA